MPDVLPTTKQAATADRDPVAELEHLRADIAARNRHLPELTEEEADELATRLVHEAIDSLAEQGKLVFERDQ